MMFFSCESTEHRYILSERVPKSEACKYYEEKIHGILTVNDYKNGKYLVAGLDSSSPTSILIEAMPEIKEASFEKGKMYSVDTVSVKCPVMHSSGVIYFEPKRFSFVMLYYLGDDGEPTGKYSFQMVDEENAEVNNFITEDASFTGDILSLTDENIFDTMVKKIVDELKEQDIFNDKSAQPLSKNIEGMDCKIFCNYNKQGAYENSEYLTLRVDVPYLMDKNGSLYFYILQYNLDGYSYVTVEGAIIYGNKKKFIYKDYDGKLKD